HRIGRTGRAGKTGIAISLLTPREKRQLRVIEAFTKQPLKRATLPTVEDIKNQREAQLLERVTVWLGRARYQRERELVAKLVEAGHDPLEIAAAAMKLARADEKQRPIAALSEVQETRPHQAEGGFKRGGQRNYPLQKNTSHEHGMVRLTFSRGRAHGIRPNDVVGTIAFHADIPGHVIGKIHIEDKRTLVDVPEKFLAQVLAKTGDYRIRQYPVNVELA
ncbi:MAG: DbpA RNA binding domain-containing protein, partial [Anaerolineales bacterium]|nr:DbpA RNA binding domain-containing protein [Anaerolineales bacterium]